MFGEKPISLITSNDSDRTEEGEKYDELLIINNSLKSSIAKIRSRTHLSIDVVNT
jgi:hypothetical protein